MLGCYTLEERLDLRIVRVVACHGDRPSTQLRNLSDSGFETSR